ncbi:unnamed protein product [Paramecium sonneborni]|uniref:Growth arrest-specific protein 8 domain-containing protein n=1 Tax=Paramecium sonneborni TaxID=65129 RepID=A0A8S1MC57_9CILI|nr:unnamed protein product [Paramecium sonneborni]
MPPKPKPKKAPQEPEDEFTKMTAQELTQNLQIFRDKLTELKQKRNYIQMDRDMVQNFFSNCLSEIQELNIKIVNKETEAEQLEETHRIQLKSYLQKVKHLEYEQEKANDEIEKDGKEAHNLENDHFSKRSDEQKRQKTHLKKLQEEYENSYIHAIEKEEKNNKKTLDKSKQVFDETLQNMEEKYKMRLQKLKEELELRLKVEIHELEERKNLHINELINNHETAFAELKQYYNTITRENLELIKNQKEEIASINAKLQKNSKIIADMKAANNNIRIPLKQATEERDILKNALKQFSKHKMSLQNLQSKNTTLTEKYAELKHNSNDLNFKYDKLLREKQELEEKFERIAMEVKKHTDLQNNVLSQQLQNMQDGLEEKEVQLKTIVDRTNMDPQMYQQLTTKIKESIEAKNQLIKNLRYSIHHATKAYNDSIRVYEAKLVEFGIPPEELGFQPLATITSSMPAGLVSQ